jgi:flavin-dependent dehydrogenase
VAIEAYDAIVVGAGPAGAAAARLLAACSLGVLVVDRPGGPRRVLAESIPPSAQKILATLGMLPAVEDAGFIRWHGNTVWWADEAPRIETFAAGTAGYQVMRAEFDRRLVALARDAGATVIEGLVRHVDLEAHTVTVRSGGSTRIFAAPLVLDCSGRAGVIARQGFRARTDAAQTVGLGGAWQTPADFGGAADTHTLVASYTDGWAWSVPVAPNTSSPPR